jgi:hypothetical protein
MAYPVSVTVEPLLVNRNRLTTAFRVILAIPHLVLVGGLGLGGALRRGGDTAFTLGGETGLLGAAAFCLAVVSWFTIVVTGNHFAGIRDFTKFYLRWRVRALAYLMLLEDEYPPFGDGPYPAAIAIDDPQGPRDRLTVGVRLILVIPHAIALVVLVVAWWLTAVLSWVLILTTGEYPRGLYQFGVGVLRWFLRVESYMLLLVDTYPPFSLEA